MQSQRLRQRRAVLSVLVPRPRIAGVLRPCYPDSRHYAVPLGPSRLGVSLPCLSPTTPPPRRFRPLRVLVPVTARSSCPTRRRSRSGRSRTTRSPARWSCLGHLRADHHRGRGDRLADLRGARPHWRCSTSTRAALGRGPARLRREIRKVPRRRLPRDPDLRQVRRHPARAPAADGGRATRPALTPRLCDQDGAAAVAAQRAPLLAGGAGEGRDRGRGLHTCGTRSSPGWSRTTCR